MDLVVKNDYDKKRLIKMITEIDTVKPTVFSWKLYRKKRSLSANALAHAWFSEIAKELKSRGSKTSSDEVKEILKYNFLGMQDKKIRNFKTGGVTVVEEIRKTRDLDRGEMCFFMDQIQAWAGGLGILLETPVESEFWKWAQEQEQ